jgi:hypothetical protein
VVEVVVDEVVVDDEVLVVDGAGWVVVVDD